VDSAVRQDNKEVGALYLANVAVQEAAYGNVAEARQKAAESLKLAATSSVPEAEAALAFAMAGETARAGTMAQRQFRPNGRKPKERVGGLPILGTEFRNAEIR
jgi:hypothetical protein